MKEIYLEMKHGCPILPIYILISARHVYHGSISKPRTFHVAGLAAGELVRDRSRSEATGG